MSISQKSLMQVLAVSALALGLTACGPNDGQTAGQKLDSTLEKTEQSAEKARMEADRALENAGQKIDDAAAKASEATKDAVSNVATTMDEASVTAKVKAALIGDAEVSALKIHVETDNGGVVTLTGEAPSQAAKERAEQLAKAVEGVHAVHNMVTVK